MGQQLAFGFAGYISSGGKAKTKSFGVAFHSVRWDSMGRYAFYIFCTNKKGKKTKQTNTPYSTISLKRALYIIQRPEISSLMIQYSVHPWPK